MPVGRTVTDAIADSLDVVLAAARQVAEQEGVMSQLAEKHTLAANTGLAYREVQYERLTAQRIASEDVELDNPQQLVDTLLSITPQVVGIETYISDRVGQRISRGALAVHGGLAQNALVRLKDLDGLTILNGATTTLAGAGVTLVSGHIGAAVGRIGGNTTERGKPPYRCVLHQWQKKDIEDEIVAGVGTYPIGEGLTARVFADLFEGMIRGAQLYTDNNITIDSSDDAAGGVFSSNGILLIQGRAPWVRPVRNEKRGGGGTHMYHYDEFAWGERQAGSFVFRILSDATAPTS